MLKNPPTNENRQIHHNDKKNYRNYDWSHSRNPQRLLNLINVPLNQEEIDILKLGLSLTPTPRQNIAQLEYGIF